jgi:hypothetical protein
MSQTSARCCRQGRGSAVPTPSPWHRLRRVLRVGATANRGAALLAQLPSALCAGSCGRIGSSGSDLAAARVAASRCMLMGGSRDAAALRRQRTLRRSSPGTCGAHVRNVRRRPATADPGSSTARAGSAGSESAVERLCREARVRRRQGLAKPRLHRWRRAPPAKARTARGRWYRHAGVAVGRPASTTRSPAASPTPARAMRAERSLTTSPRAQGASPPERPRRRAHRSVPRAAHGAKSLAQGKNGGKSPGSGGATCRQGKPGAAKAAGGPQPGTGDASAGKPAEPAKPAAAHPADAPRRRANDPAARPRPRRLPPRQAARPRRDGCGLQGAPAASSIATSRSRSSARR